MMTDVDVMGAKQMDIFNFIPDPSEMPLREPCNRRCDVECYSKECFVRRGYIWHPEGRHNWLRDDSGNIIIGPKSCDWIPKDKKCGNCLYCHTYVDAYTCEPLGLMCVINSPSATDVYAEKTACDDWKEGRDDWEGQHGT